MDAYGVQIAHPLGMGDNLWLKYVLIEIFVMTWPHFMCYSHFGNGVHDGTICITQWGFNDRYKVNHVAKWGKFGNGNGVCR